MGSQPYWYFTPYKPDLNDALQTLREREFKAGRYNPVIRYIEFPIVVGVQEPGPAHNSIDDAIGAAAEEGTRSILDIDSIGGMNQVGVAVPLDEESLEELFDTTLPTHEMIEANIDLFGKIDRGEAIYIVVYKNGKSDELFFAGYSFD